MTRFHALSLSLILVVISAAAIAAAEPIAQQDTKAAATVNINTASVTDLQKLPGIGAATATRIIEYRQKNGPFKKAEELMNVRGIGEKSFLKLKPLVSVAPPRTEPIDR